MPNRKCFVSNCNSRYTSCKSKVSLFAVTKSRLNSWSSAIPGKERLLTTKDVVCEKHFDPQCVLRDWKAPNSTITIPLKKCKLSDGALPTIFSNCPHYLSENIKQRKPPTTSYLNETKSAKIRELQNNVITDDVSLQTLDDNIVVKQEYLASEEDSADGNFYQQFVTNESVSDNKQDASSSDISEDYNTVDKQQKTEIDDNIDIKIESPAPEESAHPGFYEVFIKSEFVSDDEQDSGSSNSEIKNPLYKNEINSNTDSQVQCSVCKEVITDR